jgi:NTP pyrophosphatase (non-canonical NTP hydrolase)
MSDLDNLRQQLLEFRKARDWEQFHKPKDIALSLVLEAAEVLEHFQWKNEEELNEYLLSHKDDIGEELADVFNWIILLANDLGVDIIEAANDKIKKNAIKYPVDKSKGTHRKYTELE